MIQPYLNTIGRYFDFTGRTGRREFWLTWLVHVVILAVCVLIDVSILAGAGFVIHADLFARVRDSYACAWSPPTARLRSHWMVATANFTNELHTADGYCDLS